MRRLAARVALAVAVTAYLVVAPASAGPVGPLPNGPVTTISTPSQGYLAVALNRGESGLVWRVARAYDTKVVVETTERTIGSLSVWVFRTVRPGSTTVRFALTNGNQPKAFQAASYRIVVRPRNG